MCLKSVLLRSINEQNKFVYVSSTALRFYSDQKCPKEPKKGKFKHYEKVIAAALIGSVVLAKYWSDKNESKKDSTCGVGKSAKTGVNAPVHEHVEAGLVKPGLPVYTAEEVAKHNSEDDIWVIFRHGVYDMTKYVKYHPGAEQILNAAGSSVEPFWNLMTDVHHNQAVFKLIETFRVGNLHDDDFAEYNDEEYWSKEPKRDPRLYVNMMRPFNAEIPHHLLHDSFYTPNEIFYCRTHMAVPDLDAENHSIKVTIKNGNCSNTKEFTLQELLKMFPMVEVKATLHCSVNRRSHMTKSGLLNNADQEVQPVIGVNWRHGAISNAVWCGVPLRPILDYCGLDTSVTKGRHVLFEGKDIDASGLNFSASIPLDQALNPNGKIILATQMNGEPLPRDHGYPVRALVPGAPGFRSVKWLESITVSTEESPSFWHVKDYRAHNPSRTWDTVDFPASHPIYYLPTTSAFGVPKDGDECVVKNGKIEVKGYAFSGGGNKILRVDVSPDQGKTWYEVNEYQQDDEPPTRHYTWTLWKAYIPVSSGQKETTLWVKATDCNFNTQPENFRDIWNIRALLANAYHKITVKLKH